MTTQLEQAWELAKQRFAAVGIDVEEALRQRSFTRVNALLARR